MAKVSLLGNAMNTIGTLPAKGSIAPQHPEAQRPAR